MLELRHMRNLTCMVKFSRKLQAVLQCGFTFHLDREIGIAFVPSNRVVSIENSVLFVWIWIFSFTKSLPFLNVNISSKILVLRTIQNKNGIPTFLTMHNMEILKISLVSFWIDNISILEKDNDYLFLFLWIVNSILYHSIIYGIIIKNKEESSVKNGTFH